MANKPLRSKVLFHWGRLCIGQTWPSRAAFVLLLIAAVALVHFARQLSVAGANVTSPAGHGMVPLQLAATPDAANAVVASWREHRLIDDALTSLTLDTPFIASYLAFGLALVWWGSCVPRGSARATSDPSRALTLLLMLAWLLTAGLDLVENRWLAAGILGGGDRAWMWASLASMSKWALLLLTSVITLALVAGRIRVSAILARRLAARAPTMLEVGAAGDSTFKRLIEKETHDVFHGFGADRASDAASIQCSANAAADEAFISFRPADIVGLALSGGGIRSATFNLGLLQGLQRLHVLRLVDYLSTVSGGGYVGAFWSAWLKGRETDSTRSLFPTATEREEQPVCRLIDTQPERHLREFSGFLVPRVGLFEVETWTVIVAFLGGLIPALLLALSVLGFGLVSWLALTFPLVWSPMALSVVTGVEMLAVLWFFERLWQLFKAQSAGSNGQHSGPARISTPYWLGALIIASAAFAVSLWGITPLRHVDRVDAYPTKPGATEFAVTRTEAGRETLRVEVTVPAAAVAVAPSSTPRSMVAHWWRIVGVAGKQQGVWQRSLSLFDVGFTWLLCALGLLLVRVVSSLRTWESDSLAMFDRLTMRVLGAGVLWMGAAAIWHAVINLERINAAAAAAIVSAGGFAALRNWMTSAFAKPATPSLFDRFKPLVPQALAYLTVVLAAILVGSLLVRLGPNWLSWWMATAGLSVVLLVGFFLQADEFGLHKFYRERLARAYAGACNPHYRTATENRSTEPREGDDLPLETLPVRPFHLVCCAANDLSGDQVETLSRGARSAVLSRHGFALGCHHRPWQGQYDSKSLGGAVTASAAAFNSNMGQLSMRLGPAVSFLMTALNLRLGLWVRHPQAAYAGPRRWPGLLLYREMFALTSASGRADPTTGELNVDLRDVHLSDGGHFENLALYELVRRHCRYIIVSDCGADPEIAFDDLGNALRRIREDFGVDISLDVSSLRPGAESHRSAQHVAVGVIHYSPTDRGTLLYVKPTMTGDEPPDVQQYGTRNKAFPHETTTDQFYDEAQWESYRRLGLHVAEEVFGFVKRSGTAGTKVSADWVFGQARHIWGATPPDLQAHVLEMSARFTALDDDLADQKYRGVLLEAFPEISEPGVCEGRSSSTQVTSCADELLFVIKVTQAMEDAYLLCQLDEWWSHPLNMGWINLFARWATSPAFRFWWPLISPMYGQNFGNFINDRFPMRETGTGVQVLNPMLGAVEEIQDPFKPGARGLAATWWIDRTSHRLRDPAPGWTFYQNCIELRRSPEGGRTSIQTGLARVFRHGSSAGWTSDDFFVPPSLWGAGIGWYFQKELLKTLADAHATYCCVVVKSPPVDRHRPVALDDRRAFIDQYRKLGFRQRLKPPAEPLFGAFEFKEADGDVLLELNLVEWMKRTDS